MTDRTRLFLLRKAVYNLAPLSCASNWPPMASDGIASFNARSSLAVIGLASFESHLRFKYEGGQSTYSSCEVRKTGSWPAILTGTITHDRLKKAQNERGMLGKERV
jgi:hypothetical protein